MIIPEGSIIQIYDNNDRESTNIDDVIANMDIELVDGENYTMLCRDERSNHSAIFETSNIIHVRVTDEYKIYGYFKDALLISRNKNYNAMLQTYMDI